jgi:excisionase family DNA binding protein
MVKLNFDSLPEQVYILRQEISEIKRLLQEGRKANQEAQPDKILNVEEAARFLRVKRQTIYEKVKKGELPVCKTPGTKRLFFSYSDLMNYIKRGRIKTNAEIAQEVDNYLINKKRG